MTEQQKKMIGKLGIALVICIAASLYICGIFEGIQSLQPTLNPATMLARFVTDGFPLSSFLWTFFLTFIISVLLMARSYSNLSTYDKMGRLFKMTKGTKTYGEAHFEDPEEYKTVAVVQREEDSVGTILGQLDESGKYPIVFREDKENRLNRHIAIVGASGSGKTYMVRTLAKLLDVPLAITDATSLTEAGYIGDDIESVVSKLLAAADNDIEKAERGIIFIDEIDKIAKKRNANQRDVSGESVQQGMLKLLEGADVEVPVGASSKNAMVPMVTVNTRNILFICGGAFPDLDNIIKERLNQESSMGFKAALKDQYDEDENILQKVTVEDIRTFGMIPEFIGRLPILFSLEALTEDMLVRILKEPRNAILKQYQKLLEMDEVKLEFEDEALYAIAKKAKEKKVGARALRAIIEEFMLDIMYEIPKDDNIGKVIITKEYIEKTGGPVIMMRGCPELEEKSAI